MADVCVLKADEIRLRRNERPESDIVQSVIEEEAQRNDLTRFKRFKQWTKKNLGGISVVAISVAGIITTIVMGARTVIKKGAQATSKFAKTLVKIDGKSRSGYRRSFKFNGKTIIVRCRRPWIFIEKFMVVSRRYCIYVVRKNIKKTTK